MFLVSLASYAGGSAIDATSGEKHGRNRRIKTHHGSAGNEQEFFHPDRKMISPGTILRHPQHLLESVAEGGRVSVGVCVCRGGERACILIPTVYLTESDTRLDLFCSRL